jgi:hypothetical protein
MWATGFINCLIYFTILARFFVQFYGLFHDSTIGSTQFPKYLSILPLIFSSCPTYFMSVPVLSFNFQAISVKMYQSDTYITLHYIALHYITLHTYIHLCMYVCMHACMHICIYSMYRNKYMYIHTWFYHVHLCMPYYMYIRIYIYIYMYMCVSKKDRKTCVRFWPYFIRKTSKIFRQKIVAE